MTFPAEAKMTLIENDFRADGVAPFAAFVSEPEIYIADEAPQDFFAREALLDAAFGPDRFEKTAGRLREGRLPAAGLALVMKHGPLLMGTLRLWHVDAGGAEALMLGPLAIAKPYRSRGFGRRLMAEGLFRAYAAGHRAVLLVGDAPYYEAFGFSRRATLGLALPGPVDEARFLGLELAPGALQGAKGLVRATGRLAPPAPAALREAA
jgi:predicted N-acetyltransferase YhbS